MTGHQHHYRVSVEWTGNHGTGTDGYRNYGREHVIRIEGKPGIAGSSDPAFRGDATRHNPEEMLVAALSTCHMLA
ncbi:MAG: OsmC family peroxiredoxin, partial [Xanthomonadaceae bacterium]|nr:OsmC family peroxiredoxin [Xanthomonadaceae bacterium]